MARNGPPYDSPDVEPPRKDWIRWDEDAGLWRPEPIEVVQDVPAGAQEETTGGTGGPGGPEAAAPGRLGDNTRAGDTVVTEGGQAALRAARQLAV